MGRSEEWRSRAPLGRLAMAFVGAAAVMALSGCGDDGVTSDAGLDGTLDGGHVSLVTPPDIPWLAEGVLPIMLAPCPLGWREVHGGAVIECDPYPEGGAESCEAGEAHFPGEEGCRPIGQACPAGDYATSISTRSPVVYVNAAAATGGDGSLAAPFTTLSDVPWLSLTTGTTVALGKGTYSGTLPLKAGMSVLGSCVRDTVLTGISQTRSSRGDSDQPRGPGYGGKSDDPGQASLGLPPRRFPIWSGSSKAAPMSP